MHCLVTGGNGYIGRALLPALAQQGYRLSAQGRPATVPVCHDPDVRFLESDFGAAHWELPLEGVDVLFHLAGIAHQQGSVDGYQAVNLDASLALARKAIAADVKRLVFVSTVKAAAAEYDESGDLLPISKASSPYAQSKALAEEGLRRLCDNAALELVIVRPALVYGENVLGHLRWLRRWTALHLPAPPPGGERSMIALADLVRLLSGLAVSTLETPALFTATDGERYSTQRLHAALCEAMGRQPWLPTPPALVWRTLCRTLDTVRGETAGCTWDRMTADDYYRPEGLESLGFSPSLNFESSLRVANGT
ncbi:NAD-dependent epimerase/dehydratase family protein [Congregibacter sp.]|uniref:NAD-dependent epimerase/dehydratase family protein n=1 Tax=Congregibacter sp. TaxID=2744308 RepID=UPI003F6BEF50